jgi:hypothetical protein
MPSSEKIVTDNMKRFASAERALERAMKAMMNMAPTFPQAYANGDIAGGDALKRRDEAVEMAGQIAVVHDKMIEFHERCTEDAKSANKDQPGAYAELPPLNPGVPQPKSGNR